MRLFRDVGELNVNDKWLKLLLKSDKGTYCQESSCSNKYSINFLSSSITKFGVTKFCCYNFFVVTTVTTVTSVGTAISLSAVTIVTTVATDTSSIL